MDELFEVQTTIEKLYQAVGRLEGHDFKTDEFYDQKNRIQITDENGAWVDVKRLIVKEKPCVKLSFYDADDTADMVLAQNHLIGVAGGAFMPAQLIAPNMTVRSVNGVKRVYDTACLEGVHKVFDMQVDSDTHLYSIANGTVHHNSEKGKSLITDVWLGQNIRQGGMSMKVDIEDSAGVDFTAKLVGGMDIAKRIHLISPKTLAATKKDNEEKAAKAKADGAPTPKKKIPVITIEKFTNIVNKTIDFQMAQGQKKSPSLLMVVDSISQMTSDKEFTDVQTEKDKRDMTAQQKMRGLFRVVMPLMRDANMTIVGIAHLTANIGVTFGPALTVNAKGTGFKYASSLTLNMVTSKEITDKKTGTPLGLRVLMKTTKNRIEYKGRQAWMIFYFQRGIDRLGGLAELLARYGVVEVKNANGGKAKPDVQGWYEPTAKYTYIRDDGEVLTFKASDMGEVVAANGGDTLLKEMNRKLNNIYSGIMEGTGEDVLLEDDDTGMEDVGPGEEA